MTRHGGDDDGFTLVEILIVLVILGILAGIVVFAIGHTRGDASNSACLADVRSIQEAEDAYHLHNNVYAATGTTLTASGSGNLAEWPGSNLLTFTLSGDTSAYSLAVGGTDVAGTTAGNELTPTSTEAQIQAACSGS